jgi:hypothetical protein
LWTTLSAVGVAQVANPLDPGGSSTTPNPLDPGGPSRTTNPLDPGGPSTVANPPDPSGSGSATASGAAVANPLDVAATPTPNYMKNWPPKNAAGQEERQWGNLIYALPSGQEVSYFADPYYADIRSEKWLDEDGYRAIRLLPGEKFTGDNNQLRAWADAQVKKHYQERSSVDEFTVEMMEWKDVTQTFGPRVVMSAGSVRKKDRDDPYELIMVMALATGNRADVVIGVANEVGPFKSMAGELGSFVEKLQFVSLTQKPLLGEPVRGPLEGIYFGSYLQPMVGLDGMMRSDIYYVTFVFYPDGRFSEEVPESGVRRLDLDAEVSYRPDEVGNYLVSGKEILLYYADGTQDTIDYEEPPGMQSGMAYLSKVDIPPDGMTFAGSRSWFHYSGFGSMASGTHGSVSAGGTIEFKKDGTLTSSRFHGVVGSFGDGMGNTTGGYAITGGDGDDPPKPGTYRVRDGRIIMTEPDGKVTNWAIFLTQEDSKQVIWVGEKPIEH